LEGVIAPENIFASRLCYNDQGEISGVECLRAGYGKVAVLDYLRERSTISQHRLVYVGDGSSDVHVMLHVNRLEGTTIAVSENKYLTQIAKRTVLSDNALSILIPIMEDVLGWSAPRIRLYMEQQGFILQEWEKVQTDTVTIVEAA
jgi:predicted HAD superfamily phosphohydrolase